ncbi:MAG TPA: sugar ABC transporter permease [Chthoniobacteraceae bacterium]|nr:sugar ABC transporter permease [Chthoniobacteraceae bacterium]
MATSSSIKKLRSEWRLYFFVLPAVVLIGTFCYFPAASAIYHSFFRWGGGDAKEFIGLANFRRAAGDIVFWESFIVIAILVTSNVIKLIPSVFMAVLIHRLKSERWQYWYRVGVVLPMIVPGLVTLFIWKFFFDPGQGALNRFLDLTGLKALLVSLDEFFHWGIFHAGLPIAWLGEPSLIIPSLIIWGFPWIGSVGVLIYLAGLQSIGNEVYEAAELDGATSWQTFRFMELPLIMTQIRLSLVMLIISTLQGYGLQFLLLGPEGGPGGRGMVPGLWMFNKAFFAGEFGYACALGIFLFLFILALTFLNQRYVRVEK